MYSLLYPLVLTTLGAGAPAEEAVKPPVGPQPQAVVAVLKDDKLAIRRVQLVTVYRQVEQTIVQGGVARQVTTTVPVQVTTHVVQSLSGKDLQGYDTNGKKLDADTVRRRLKKDTPVVISADGKPVDPFYLKLLRPGTLVLVVPAYARGEGAGPMFPPGERLKPIPVPREKPIKRLPKD